MNNELNANILNIVKEKIDNIKDAKQSGRRSAVIDYRLKSPINRKSMSIGGLKSLDYTKLI